jgi:hypothetical protein
LFNARYCHNRDTAPEHFARRKRILYILTRITGENPKEEPNKSTGEESPLINLLHIDYRPFIKAVHDFGHKNACPAEES